MSHHKYAFTLAEVLITLGIIGVVAGLTLPTIINYTNNKQHETGAYKNLSILSNAVMRSYALGGEYINSYGSANNLKKNLFFKHLKVLKDNSNEEMQTTWIDGIEPEESFYLVDGAKYGISQKITDNCDYNLNNIEENIPCYIVFVDVNGDKKPNELTMSINLYKDINAYYIYSDVIVMEPGEIRFLGGFSSSDNNDTGNNADNNINNPENTGDDDSNNDNNNDNNNNNNNNNGHNNGNHGGKKKCTDLRSPAECEIFCRNNGYHSSLCRE